MPTVTHPITVDKETGRLARRKMRRQANKEARRSTVRKALGLVGLGRARVKAAKPAKVKKAKSRPVGRRDLPWILRAPRMLFLFLSGVMVLGITVVGMIESWRNLYEWGLAHHYGSYAVGVPIMVDFFILAAEMLLFVTIVDGRYGLFANTTKIYLWVMFFFGLVLSLGGNIDHLRHADVPSRIGFALPPLASAMGMAAILMVLKMIAEDYDGAPAEEPRGEPAQAAPVAKVAPITTAPSNGGTHAPKGGAPVSKVAHHANGASAGASRRRTTVDEETFEAVLVQLRRIPLTQDLPGQRTLAASYFGNNRRAAAKALTIIDQERRQAGADDRDNGA